jgi:hypothetical protein
MRGTENWHRQMRGMRYDCGMTDFVLPDLAAMMTAAETEWRVRPDEGWRIRTGLCG